jgi:hypothetical protein
MTVYIYASKLICNNETSTIGSYNWFSILIRDKDGCVNVTKLVQLINKKEKQVTNSKLFKCEWLRWVEGRIVKETARSFDW